MTKDRYKGELKVGMKVMLYRNNLTLIGEGTINSVNERRAICSVPTKNYDNWEVQRRSNGYWGGDITSGFLVPVSWKQRLGGQ